MFSAGYDIGGLPRDEFADRAEELVAHPFHDAIEALEAYPYPAVAALNGHAIGGGLELALSCDLIVAAEDAVVGMPPAKLGLVYSHTGLRKFVDAIGVTRTRQLFHVARNVCAATAVAWGLVNEVVAGRRARRARGRATRPRSPPTRRSRWRATSASCASCWPPRAARPRRRARADRAARGLLPHRRLLRGRARVRREAPAALAGALRAAILLAALALAALAARRRTPACATPSSSRPRPSTSSPGTRSSSRRRTAAGGAGARELVDATLLVLREYRAAHPDAPRVLHRRPLAPPRRPVRRAASAGSATRRTRTGSTSTSTTRAATSASAPRGAPTRSTASARRSSSTASSPPAPSRSSSARAAA